VSGRGVAASPAAGEGILRFHELDLAPVRALLCDADGNLFPSEEPAFVASARVTNRALAALGLTRRYSAEELRLATTGRNFRTTIADLAAASGIPVEGGPTSGLATAGAPVLTRAALERWVAEERREVTAHLARELRPDPAVAEPLTRLSRRYTLAAVSSSAAARLEACFAATGLAALFPPARCYSAEDSLAVPTGKPDPAIYVHAAGALAIAPGEGLAIEDSVPGALSALAAGLPTVGNVMFVPPGEREARIDALREAGVAAVVSSWHAIEEVLA
jgi:HAD superfamily hydrolase (TIGR01509 family)